MRKSIGQSVGRVSFLAGSFTVILFLASCQDLMTFSLQGESEGMRLYSERMYGDAAGAFRNSVRQDPQNYHSHFYLGVCMEELKEYQQAFQSYYTALEVMSHTPAGRFDDEFRLIVLDTLAEAIAQHDLGETELNKAENRAKTSQKAEDWFMLAKVYRIKGDADMAMDCYRRAAKWDNTSFPIRKEFGLYLLDPLNQRPEAEYYLRQAYRIEPNDEAVNGALARLGITPLIGDKAKDATPRIVPPYTGPLPTDVARTPDGRVNLNGTVAKPKTGVGVSLPRD
jgi:tetratricopeptide (TPR) repeat protein